MKRIEEFTAEELRNAWDNESSIDEDAMQFVLDYIKANLDTGKREPMSVEELCDFFVALEEESSDNMRRDKNTNQCLTNLVWLAEKLQPLTVQQGFVVDWSKAPEYAVRAAVVWTGQELPEHREFHSFPRPAPKMMQKTREKKISEIVAKIGDNGMLWEYSDEVVDYICRAAGIPLETKE